MISAIFNERFRIDVVCVRNLVKSSNFIPGINADV